MLDITTTKIRILYLVLMILSINIILYMEYNRRVDLVYAMLGKEAEDTASLVSRLIKRNYSKECESLFSTMDSNSSEYKAIKEFLVDCKEASKYKFIYTFKLINHGRQIVYVVDSEHDNSPLISPIGTVENTSGKGAVADLVNLNKGAVPHDVYPYVDKWGTFISGYAPIQGSDGWGPLGFVAVDIDKETISSMIAPKTIMYLTYTGLINVVLLLALLLMAHSYKKGSEEQKKREKLVTAYLHQFDKEIKTRLLSMKR